MHGLFYIHLSRQMRTSVLLYYVFFLNHLQLSFIVYIFQVARFVFIFFHFQLFVLVSNAQAYSKCCILLSVQC